MFVPGTSVNVSPSTDTWKSSPLSFSLSRVEKNSSGFLSCSLQTNKQTVRDSGQQEEEVSVLPRGLLTEQQVDELMVVDPPLVLRDVLSGAEHLFNTWEVFSFWRHSSALRDQSVTETAAASVQLHLKHSHRYNVWPNKTSWLNLEKQDYFWLRINLLKCKLNKGQKKFG